MATQSDVRRIAMSLPGAIAAKDRFAFSVQNKDKEKGFVWVWKERVHPKKARVPNPKVLAVRVANLEEKDLLLAADGEKFFTEPHYNGFPAVLVRLAAVRVAELRALVTAAWRCVAPAALGRKTSYDGVTRGARPSTPGRRRPRAPRPSPARQ
jgi:hypothetical protein